MLLGKIFGKVTTTDFKFLVEQETKKFDYIQVYHAVYDYTLCQVIELEKQENMTVAHCQVIGYKDKKDGKIKRLRIPFEPGTEVFGAENYFITDIIKLDDSENGAYIGKLEGRDIDVRLDLKKLLTKHVAVLAKSGSGKSYAVGVLLEEITEKKVPLLVIDPHGEYSSMKFPNNNEEEAAFMPGFKIKPKGYNINEYGDTTVNPTVRPLRLPSKLTSQELIDMLPVKLSSTQLGTLYSATQNMEEVDFDQVIYALQQEEANTKWNIISVVEQLKNVGLFSNVPTPYHELVKSGSCSIINFKGIDPEIQDIIMYKLTKDLFELRKQNKIPPFFLVVEEAHNYCPERSFGEKKSSKILRTLASEGRKFGLGLCVISQRPARVDKSVLSQCSTQLILKVTNPNDLKAITTSVEGITHNTEKEIQELPIGTALVTGITDVPLFVKVRTRKSLHGGHAIDILNEHKNVQVQPEEKSLIDDVKEFEEKEILPLVMPNTTPKDLMLMSEKKIKKIHTKLIPVFVVSCKEKEEIFKLLINRTNGAIIVDKESMQEKFLPALEKLSKKELKILHIAFTKKTFSAIDLVHEMGANLDVKQELDSLQKAGYLEATGADEFHISEKYIFSTLSNYKVFEEIKYDQYDYEEKLEPTLSIDQISAQLDKFTTIVDHAEANLVSFDIEYEAEQQ